MLSASIAIAGDHKGHGQRTGLICPQCTEPCYPTVTKGKETRHCWGVETKTICIPRVRWPWETWGKGDGKSGGCGDKCDSKAHGGKGHGGKCAGGKCGAKCPEVNCLEPKCGRTRVVNVLVKHTYECSVCKYTWEPAKGVKSSPKVAPPKVYDSAAAPSYAEPLRATPVVYSR